MNSLDTVLNTVLYTQYLSDPLCVVMDFQTWKRTYRPPADTRPTSPATLIATGKMGDA